MPGSRRRVALVVVALAAGLLLLAWAAATGPGDAVRGGDPAGFSQPTPAPSPTASATAHDKPVAPPPPRPHRVLDLSWLGALIQVVIALLLLAGLVLLGRNLLERWRERPREERTEAEFDLLPDVAAARKELRRQRDAQFAALGRGTARSGIVACWVLFEEAAARAGVARAPADTSTELVTRLLHRLDVDPRSVGELARLYREARFSSHRLPETARDTARAALDQVHADLGARSPAGGLP